MSDAWRIALTTAGDWSIGWLMLMPRDVAVVAIGITIGLALWLGRWLVTDPSRMDEIRADRRRLRDLLRSARGAQDWSEVARLEGIRGQVLQRKAVLDLKLLFLAAPLLLMTYSWGHARLSWLPPAPGQWVRFTAYFPAAMIGEAVHVVPWEGGEVQEGWVRAIRGDVHAGRVRGRADWLLRDRTEEPEFWIQVRTRERSFLHDVSQGGWRYAAPHAVHSQGITTSLALVPYRPFELIPAEVWPGVPGWALVWTTLIAAIWLVSAMAARNRE